MRYGVADLTPFSGLRMFVHNLALLPAHIPCTVLWGKFQSNQSFLSLSEGGILPRITFGGQISSLGIPAKFFRAVERKPTFGAISFISYVFPCGPRKKPTKFFRREICPLQNLLATKFYPPPPGSWGFFLPASSFSSPGERKLSIQSGI